MKRWIFILVLLFLSGTCFSQGYQERYLNAKQFFKEGRYNLAMELFESLIPYNVENPFSEYASFYYALSAYHQGYESVARSSFEQIKAIYPEWDKLNEVEYWLAVIHFKNEEYFQALNSLRNIDDRRMQDEVSELKQYFLSKLTDRVTLASLYDRYEDDRIIAENYAMALAREKTDQDAIRTLEVLVNKFKFDPSAFKTIVPESFKKDSYNVAVLFPFRLELLDPTPMLNTNIIANLYQGMELALDTLKQMGVTIDLRVYDTKNNPGHVRNLLSTEELKQADVIVGPLLSAQLEPVKEFTLQNRINMINPVSSQVDWIKGNPYAFIYQPGYEALGRKAARFLDNYLVDGKRVMIIYDRESDDTTSVRAFLQEAKETGLEIFSLVGVTKETSRQIIDTLSTPTEVNEFDKPLQYTLPLDSLDAVYVPSNSPLIFSNVIGSVESRGDHVVVLGTESMLDKTLSEYGRFERLGVVMMSPNFVPLNHPWYQRFRSQFMQRHGRIPDHEAKVAYRDEFSLIGYQLMLFLGKVLNEYGVYFQEGIQQQAITPGWMRQGYDFTGGNDNQFIPFIKFEKGELVLIKNM